MASAARTVEPEKVLYIADLWELLPEDALRKGRSTPLEWGKLRSPADRSEAGLRYQMRCQAIKADPRGGFAVLGIFYELLAIYGFARTATLRGWIVNHDYRAAGPAQIAQAIGGANVDSVKEAVELLISVGLLAWYPLPDLAAALEHDRTVRPGAEKKEQVPKPKQPGRAKPATSEAPKDKAGEGGERPAGGRKTSARKGGRRRKVSGRRPASGRKPAGPRPARGRPAAGPRTSDVRQETGDGETADVSTPATAAAAPQPPPADGNGLRPGDTETATASPAPDVEGAPGGDGQLAAGEDQARDGNAPPDATAGAAPPVDPAASASPPPPAAAEPLQPTEADRPGGEETRHERGAGVGSYSPESAELLADQTMRLLYPYREDLVCQGRKATPPQGPEEFQSRERGAIVNAWAGVLHCLDCVGVARLEQRAAKEAARLVKKRTRKPRGACWLYWLSRHMGNAVGASRWKAAMYAARTGLALGPPEGGL